MGRKPDTTVLTYFDRGEKLPDQSNRYSYTCKGCGAVFPKGRTNHLLDHLISNISRCPAVTPEDLANILAAQAIKSADRARKEALRAPAEDALPTNQNGSNPNAISAAQAPRQTKLLLGQGKKLSGLEALAEASRQVGGALRSSLEDFQSSNHNDHQASIDPLIDPNLSSLSMTSPAFSPPFQDLSSIAASASDLEASLLHFKKHVEDSSKSQQEQGDRNELNHASTWHVPIRPAPDFTLELAKAATFPRPLVASPSVRNSPSGDFDVQGPPSKVMKTRSKFTESRRQEVQGVRQKRACIRCRMLRKPVRSLGCLVFHGIC